MQRRVAAETFARVFRILSDFTSSLNLILLCVQAYEKARESVHAQKVIQGRGTMNK